MATIQSRHTLHCNLKGWETGARKRPTGALGHSVHPKGALRRKPSVSPSPTPPRRGTAALPRQGRWLGTAGCSPLSTNELHHDTAGTTLSQCPTHTASSSPVCSPLDPANGQKSEKHSEQTLPPGLGGKELVISNNYIKHNLMGKQKTKIKSPKSLSVCHAQRCHQDRLDPSVHVLRASY